MKRAILCLLFAVCLCLPAAAAASGPPTIEYLAPEPRNQEATVHFTIDPEGFETQYEVEYGPAAGDYNESNESWTGTLPAGDDPVALEATFPAFFEGQLVPGTTYHYRVVAKSDGGTTEGADQTFTTSDEPAPVLTTSPVGASTTDNVHFEGTVDPEGNSLTGCRFRWVTDSVFHNAGFEKWAANEFVRFGETVPCAESTAAIGSGTEPVIVHADVAGLEPGLYYVRLEGENAYEGATAFGGVPFEVTAASEVGEVGKGCEHDPGCGPPETKPPAVTPPQGPPAAAAAKAKAKKKKLRQKKRRHRAHQNSRLVARR